MSKPVQDALIREILDVCAGKAPLRGENEPMGIGRYTSALAPYDRLFSPIRLGALTLSGRCLIAPLSLIGNELCPGEETQRFYLARADAALLTTGPIPAGYGEDPFLAQRWLPLNEKLHARGAKIFFQIAPDGTPPQQAANLAARALPGGFDGLCLNARLSDDTLLETVAAVHERLGARFPILCRVSLSRAEAESGVSDGRKKSAAPLAERLELMTALARAGVDAFEVTLGGAETPWLLSPSERFPAGCYAEAARALKAHFRCLGIEAAVIASGRLAYPDLDEALLARDMCDMVSLDGAGIDDPDWLRLVRQGRSEEIAPLRLPAYHVEDGAWRIAVVGAGLKGIGYALRAADRGIAVDLFEAREQIGGRAALLSSPLAFEDENCLGRLRHEVENQPLIRVLTRTRADGALLKNGGYDRIVFACAAAAVTPPHVPGWGEIPFVSGDGFAEALSGKWRKKQVTVLGSDALACDLAWRLQSEGLARRVTLLSENPLLPGESEAERQRFLHFFRQQGGVIISGCCLQRMRRHAIFYRNDPDGKDLPLHCDRIVLLEKEPAPLRLYREALADRLAPEIILL